MENEGEERYLNYGERLRLALGATDIKKQLDDEKKEGLYIENLKLGLRICLDSNNKTIDELFLLAKKIQKQFF
jgi:hypothetical protein